MINYGLQSPNFLSFRASSASASIWVEILTSRNPFSHLIYPCLPEFRWNMPIWMSYVKYKDKSTVSKTRWPGNRIKRALPREFSVPTAWSFASMDASSASHITGLWPDKSTRGLGRSGASPCGFESGDSNLSKLTIVFATMQLTGPGESSRLVMPIPLAINLCIFKARNELIRIA
jgi:hypothetical protein